MVRIPGVCNGNTETTVLAHIRRGGVAGMGQKPPDTCGVWACNACHDVLDGRARAKFDWDGLSRERIIEICEQLTLDSDALKALTRQLAWYDKHEILIPVL